MNTLTVQNASLIGSSEDFATLAKKTSAKILVVSDSHGEADLFEQIIRGFGSECDALVFCGDGICDLIACINSATIDDKLAFCIPPVVVCARGNGDADQYAMHYFSDKETKGTAVPKYFNVSPSVMVSVAGRNVLCVHGHRHGADFGSDALAATAEKMDIDIAFFGHTHRPHREETDATLILNPGSCSRPRGGFPPTFAVVSFPGSTERYQVDFFEIKETLFGGYNFNLFLG